MVVPVTGWQASCPEQSSCQPHPCKLTSVREVALLIRPSLESWSPPWGGCDFHCSSKFRAPVQVAVCSVLFYSVLTQLNHPATSLRLTASVCLSICISLCAPVIGGATPPPSCPCGGVGTPRMRHKPPCGAPAARLLACGSSSAWPSCTSTPPSQCFCLVQPCRYAQIAG